MTYSAATADFHAPLRVRGQKDVLPPGQRLSPAEHERGKARINIVVNGNVREQVADVSDLALLERIAGSQEHTFGDLPGGVASFRRFVQEAALTNRCAFASQRLDPLPGEDHRSHGTGSTTSTRRAISDYGCNPAERMDRCRAQHCSSSTHRSPRVRLEQTAASSCRQP